MTSIARNITPPETNETDYGCDSFHKDKSEISPVKPTRDPDEGMGGPVYYYCQSYMKDFIARVSE